ncbi:MAG: transcription-repair coupling factor, partial [Oxalobacteraceae bacterium]
MPFDLKKHLPKPGTRFALPALYGSSDAYALAQAALALKAKKQMLTVIVANASDGQRLLDEIPWFADGKLACHLLPDWETLPYDAFSPHQDLVSERLATLHEIRNGQCDVLVVPATTALVRLAPPSFLAAYTFFFRQGETLDEARLKAQLTLAGYTHVSQVMSPGEYSVRGGLIDLFPMGSALPYRLDLFGDEIETIRTFDADTQRSLYPVREVRLLPGREFPMDETARTAFRGRWRERFEGDPTRSPVYKDIGSGIASAGIEYYLPLFFDDTATLFDYLPDDASLALVGDIEASIGRFWSDTESRYKFLKADRERPILEPKEIFLAAEDFFVCAKRHGRWTIQRDLDGQPSELSAPLPDIAVNRRLDDPLAN